MRPSHHGVYDYKGVKYHYGQGTETGEYCHKDDRECILEGNSAVVVWTLIFSAVFIIFLMFIITACINKSRIQEENKRHA